LSAQLTTLRDRSRSTGITGHDDRNTQYCVKGGQAVSVTAKVLGIPKASLDNSVRLSAKGLDNVVLTPHNAPGSEATRRAMANLAADNLIAALGFGPHAFRPANAVNPEVLDRKPASVAINSWPVPN